MKPVNFLFILIIILIQFSCQDDCKEAQCNPHPEGGVIVNEKCECSCRNKSEIVYNFYGDDICITPEKENQIIFLRTMLTIDSLKCNENKFFVVGLIIDMNDERPNQFEYRLTSAPNGILSSGNLLYIPAQNEYTFDQGLGHGDNYLMNDVNCVTKTINFRAVGEITEDGRQFIMRMTTFGSENLEDVLNNENPLATYDIVFDRLVQ